MSFAQSLVMDTLRMLSDELDIAVDDLFYEEPRMRLHKPKITLSRGVINENPTFKDPEYKRIYDVAQEVANIAGFPEVGDYGVNVRGYIKAVETAVSNLMDFIESQKMPFEIDGGPQEAAIVQLRCLGRDMTELSERNATFRKYLKKESPENIFGLMDMYGEYQFSFIISGNL